MSGREGSSAGGFGATGVATVAVVALERRPRRRFEGGSGGGDDEEDEVIYGDGDGDGARSFCFCFFFFPSLVAAAFGITMVAMNFATFFFKGPPRRATGGEGERFCF